MRFITWNIQWGQGIDARVDLERIVRTARSLADFDVICMQEVADNFAGLEGAGERDQFAELARLLPGHTPVAGHGVDLAGEGGRRRRFGNVIFSRYDVLSARRHALPWPADPPHRSMPRVAVEATVRAPLGPVRITTTHLEYYSELQRRAQAARLRELHAEACARAAHPEQGKRGNTPFDPAPQTALAILAGDFNFRPAEAAYAEVVAALPGGAPAYRDAWAIVHGHRPHTPTFCVHSDKYGSPYCCDFVFVSEPLAGRVRGIRVDSDTRASDHQPVALELDDR